MYMQVFDSDAAYTLVPVSVTKIMNIMEGKHKGAK